MITNQIYCCFLTLVIKLDDIKAMSNISWDLAKCQKNLESQNLFQEPLMRTTRLYEHSHSIRKVFLLHFEIFFDICIF